MTESGQNERNAAILDSARCESNIYVKNEGKPNSVEKRGDWEEMEWQKAFMKERNRIHEKGIVINPGSPQRFQEYPLSSSNVGVFNAIDRYEEGGLIRESLLPRLLSSFSQRVCYHTSYAR